MVEDKRVVVFDCVLNLGLAAAGANAEAAVAVSKRVSSFMIVAVVMALLCYCFFQCIGSVQSTFYVEVQRSALAEKNWRQPAS